MAGTDADVLTKSLGLTGTAADAFKTSIGVSATAFAALFGSTGTVGSEVSAIATYLNTTGLKISDFITLMGTTGTNAGSLAKALLNAGTTVGIAATGVFWGVNGTLATASGNVFLGVNGTLTAGASGAFSGVNETIQGAAAGLFTGIDTATSGVTGALQLTDAQALAFKATLQKSGLSGDSLALSLGLTGTAADAFSGNLGLAGLKATSLSDLLGLAGTAAQSFANLVGGLNITLPTQTPVTAAPHANYVGLDGSVYSASQVANAIAASQAQGFGPADLFSGAQKYLSATDAAAALHAAGIPGFAVGTNYVPRDMLAQIHQGEAIIPAAFNPERYGKASGNDALIAEIKALRAEVAALRDEQKAGHSAIAKNTAKAAKTLQKFDIDGNPPVRT
jgi:hypothetical protein